MVIVCAPRAIELRHAGRPVWAVALGLAAVLAVLACAALIAFGLRVMVDK